MDASISVLSRVIACSLDGNIGGHYNMDDTARQIDTPPPGGLHHDVAHHDAWHHSGAGPA